MFDGLEYSSIGFGLQFMTTRVTLELWLVTGQDLVVDVVASLSGLLKHDSGLF